MPRLARVRSLDCHLQATGEILAHAGYVTELPDAGAPFSSPSAGCNLVQD
jgi:hypothetical protein